MTCEHTSDEEFSLEGPIDLRSYNGDINQVIEARRCALNEAGFSEDFISHLGEKKPTLIADISVKIQGFSERGFTDPIKMMESTPTILALTFETIDSKIQFLHDRGFKNPIKLTAGFGMNSKVYGRDCITFELKPKKLLEAYQDHMGIAMTATIKRYRI